MSNHLALIKKYLWPLLLSAFALSSCVSHLRDAKYFYAQGEKFSRAYQTEKALSSYKNALTEADLEIKRYPSAQAYMVKGMAEMNLELWGKAEESFLSAFTYGFEKGEEWSAQLSLLGMAVSFHELGLEDSATEFYEHLFEKAKFKPVTLFAAQRYTDIVLQRALQRQGKEKDRLLTDLLKKAERLVSKDLSCGFYHYLQSQILSHLSQFRKSFEQAVMARELGLPTLEILRDNDNQIIFCFRRLRETLATEEGEKFLSVYMGWVKKWNWKGPETPDWKER